MFSSNSRYHHQPTTTVTLADGRVVTVVVLPRRAPPAIIGYHRRLEEQRLDLLAHHFLGDATRTWRLCDANGALCADALAARELIAIPPKDA